MDEISKHAELNKLDTKEYILYGSTYNKLQNN